MRYNTSVVLAYFRECGLPEPEVELVFAPPRRWRFDYCWVDQKLALEVDGGAFVGGRHTRGAGFVKDMEKSNEAAALGYRLIRVQPKDLCILSTVNLIKRCLRL